MAVMKVLEACPTDITGDLQQVIIAVRRWSRFTALFCFDFTGFQWSSVTEIYNRVMKPAGKRTHYFACVAKYTFHMHLSCMKKCQVRKKPPCRWKSQHEKWKKTWNMKKVCCWRYRIRSKSSSWMDSKHRNQSYDVNRCLYSTRDLARSLVLYKHLLTTRATLRPDSVSLRESSRLSFDLGIFYQGCIHNASDRLSRISSYTTPHSVNEHADWCIVWNNLLLWGNILCYLQEWIDR